MSTILTPFQLLELNVISAQDLAPVRRKMKAYAVAWVHPERKLSTRVDTHGRNNPTWNDKFVFRVDDSFLYCDTSAVMIEIYAVHWFRDIHVGTVRVIVGNLISSFKRRHHNHQRQLDMGMKFEALQVRRPSGRPQGILNIGISLLNSSMRSMPLYTQLSISAIGFSHLMGDDDRVHHHQNKEDYDNDATNSNLNNQLLLQWIPKPELRRIKSDSSSMLVPSRNVATSMVSASEFEEMKHENKTTHNGRSRASSMISGKEFIKKRTSRNHNAKDLSLAKEKHESKRVEETLNTSYDVINNNDHNNNDKNHKTIVRNKPETSYKFNNHNNNNNNNKALDIVAAKHPRRADPITKVKYNNNYRVEETESEVMGGAWSLESSIEGLQSKLERWRAELPPVYDASELPTICSSNDVVMKGRRGRSRPRMITLDDRQDDDDHDIDGGETNGSFSCFSRICGVECSIVCCGPPPPQPSRSKRRSGRIKRSPSTIDFSLL